MAADERPSVNQSVGEDSQPRVARRRRERRSPPLALAHLGLDARPVRLFANRLDVYSEEDVAHGRVADNHNVIYAPPVEAQPPRHFADFEVDGRQDDLPQFAVKLAAVV